MTDPTTASTSYWTQIRTHAAPPATAPGAAAALAAAADPTLSLEIGMLRLALVRLVEEEADAGRFAQGVARLVAASVQATRLQRELTAATEQARREAEMRHSLEALDRDFGSAAYQPPGEDGGWPDDLGGEETSPPDGRPKDSTAAPLPIEGGGWPAVPRSPASHGYEEHAKPPDSASPSVAAPDPADWQPSTFESDLHPSDDTSRTLAHDSRQARHQGQPTPPSWPCDQIREDQPPGKRRARGRNHPQAATPSLPGKPYKPGQGHPS